MPRRARHRTLVLLAALGAGAIAMLGAAPPDESRPSADALVRQIVSAQNARAMCRDIEQLFAIDRVRAGELCLRLVRSRSLARQAMGAGLLGRHATPVRLARVVQTLHVTRHQEARRWLVRAIGTQTRRALERSVREARETLPEVLDALEPFLRDNDQLVRSAALAALADCRSPAALIESVRSMSAAPVPSLRWAQPGKDGVVTLNQYGAVRTLFGMVPENPSDVRRFVRQFEDRLLALPLGTVPEPEELPRTGGDLDSRYFSVRFQNRKRTDVSALPVSGDEQLRSMLDRAAERAIASAEPYFGRAHLPVFRLELFPTTQGLASLGGASTGFSGVTVGNTIGLVWSVGPAMTTTLTHEYVHAINSGHVDITPRWLSEGLAKSLTESRRESSWPAMGLRSEHLRRFVEQGAFQSLFNWNAGASTDSMERARYDLAHLVVDYLRFRGFPEHEARLMFFVNRVAFGEGPRGALQNVYGFSMPELEQDLRRWIFGN